MKLSASALHVPVHNSDTGTVSLSQFVAARIAPVAAVHAAPEPQSILYVLRNA